MVRIRCLPTVYPQDKQEASTWLKSLKEYVAANSDKVKGSYSLLLPPLLEH